MLRDKELPKHCPDGHILMCIKYTFLGLDKLTNEII